MAFLHWLIQQLVWLVGEPIDVGQNQIDICCISAPVGLAIVSISGHAKKAMNDCKTHCFINYVNLQIFKGYIGKGTIPFTMRASNIEALDVALVLKFS